MRLFKGLLSFIICFVLVRVFSVIGYKLSFEMSCFIVVIVVVLFFVINNICFRCVFSGVNIFLNGSVLNVFIVCVDGVSLVIILFLELLCKLLIWKLGV